MKPVTKTEEILENALKGVDYRNYQSKLQEATAQIEALILDGKIEEVERIPVYGYINSVGIRQEPNNKYKLGRIKELRSQLTSPDSRGEK